MNQHRLHHPPGPISVAATCIIAAIVFAAAPVQAITPSQWVHQTEAQFQQAQLDQAVVTNLGQVQLSRISERLAELPGVATIVYDLAVGPGGTWYLATGPEGRVAHVGEDHAIEFVRELSNEQVFALAGDGQRLFIAVSGADSRIEVFDGDQVTRTIDLPGVRYVWDVVLRDNVLWLATGTQGRVVMVDLAADQPLARIALDSPQKNVLCLAVDARGRVYAGTDTDGLVYRITRNAQVPLDHAEVLAEEPDEADGDADASDDDGDGPKEEAEGDAEGEGEGVDVDADADADADADQPQGPAPFTTFAMYDAAEPEIGALLVGSDGAVYAGTADAEQARPGRLTEAVGEPRGRLEPGQALERAGEAGEGDGDDAPPPPPDLPDNQPDADPIEGDGEADADAAGATADDDLPAFGVAGAGEAPAPDAEGADDGGDADASPAPDQAGASGPAAAPQPPAKPTPQQYDKLRQVVRDRLQKLRRGQTFQVTPATPTASGRLRPRRPTGGNAAPPAAPQQGNAVYRIGADGIVRELFRESVMVLRLVEFDGKLIVGTGNEGQVYRVDPATEEITVLADLDAKQVLAMRVIDDQVIIGSANPAKLIRLGAGFAEAGTFTSDPLDAQQPSRFGTVQVVADVPENTLLTIETRSGNIADPAQGHWSAWSEPAAVEPKVEGQPVFIDVDSPAARFLQYRLTLNSDGEQTPSVTKVAIMYLLPNLRPTIASLAATYPEPGGADNAAAQAQTSVNIQWEAADPNGDTLEYTLEARQLGTDQPYLEIASDLANVTSYEWDTRTMPDGRYRIRLIASDSPDNVPDQVLTTRRASAQVVVDNNPPQIEKFQVAAGDAAGTARVSAEVEDAWSMIRSVRYAVDGQKQWQPVLPADLIYDSTSERVSFMIRDLSPGRHVISLRVVDQLGNARYASKTVEVAE